MKINNPYKIYENQKHTTNYTLKINDSYIANINNFDDLHGFARGHLINVVNLLLEHLSTRELHNAKYVSELLEKDHEEKYYKKYYRED